MADSVEEPRAPGLFPAAGTPMLPYTPAAPAVPGPFIQVQTLLVGLYIHKSLSMPFKSVPPKIQKFPFASTQFTISVKPPGTFETAGTPWVPKLAVALLTLLPFIQVHVPPCPFARNGITLITPIKKVS